LKKSLHDWIGFVAAAMVAAASLYFLSPWAESLLGAERTRVLQFVIFGLFAVFGLRYFLRFLGVLTRRRD